MAQSYSIENQRFSSFKRWPSQLRRYLEWAQDIRKTHGDIAKFVCQERLQWSASSTNTLEPYDSSITTPDAQFRPKSSIPFDHRDDYRILRNDWPYAVPSDVCHLVVWLKTPFESTRPDGHLTPASRAQIQAFVERQFVEPMKDIYGDECGNESVLWFKNWSALQSVGALEHFHCLVKGANDSLLEIWLGEHK